MLRRAALQEHEARGHGDGDEGALGAVAGVEEEDHRASLAPAAAAVARVDDETRFWARGRLLAGQRCPWLCVLSQLSRRLAALGGPLSPFCGCHELLLGLC